MQLIHSLVTLVKLGTLTYPTANRAYICFVNRFGQINQAIIIAAAASEPEANERGSSLIDRRFLY